MPPKKGRQELARLAAAQQVLTPEIIAKRTKRHLDELERSNYAEPAIFAGVGEEDEEGGNKYSKGRGRQTISDKRQLNILGNSPAARKKKSTMNVRTALLYRKNLATLIEESHIASLPSNVPTYLTATAPRPPYPPRLICSVCGYHGRYKCRRCGMPYCDLNCEGIHVETRCERRVI
jgi:zinc finger HIT domain-containing protein 1